MDMVAYGREALGDSSTASMGQIDSKNSTDVRVDFWTNVRTLVADARKVELLPPGKLLVALKRAPEAPSSGLGAEAERLERSIQIVRKGLERAVGKSPSPNDSVRSFMADLINKEKLLQASVFTERMAWTRQALSKALEAKRMFFVEVGDSRYYPSFYADARYERGHLEAITKLLGDLPGGAKLQFFLNARGSLNKATPLHALARGQLAAVQAAAEGFAQV